MLGTLLLTGANGMVGRNIQDQPGLSEWNVLAPKRAELDLADFNGVESYIAHCKPDIIVHAAGRVGGIHANIADPVGFLVENVDIGRNIIMAAFRAGVPRLLNLASSCMYPRDRATPLTEDLILTGELEPTNEGYAIGKIFAARLCQYIRRKEPKFKYKTLIPCNIYGRYDKFDPSYSHLVPAIIHKIHQARTSNEEEVEIWGDGSARREFMYAGDLADAVIKAARDIDIIPEIMNIGLYQDFTVNEYYQEVAAAMNWQGHFVHDLSKPVGMSRKKVDITRQSDWGWAPSFSLKQGIAETCRYYLETMK